MINLFDHAYGECDKLSCEEGKLLIPGELDKTKTSFQCLGSISQPILINNNCFYYGSHSLNDGEQIFIESFLSHLIDKNEWSKYKKDSEIEKQKIKSPIEKDGKYYYILKIYPRGSNQPSLKIDDSDLFYPDFIIWITNETQTQQDILFVDPKGLRSIEDGWENYKILSFIYATHELTYQIKNQLKDSNIQINFKGAMLSSKETYEDFNNAGFFINLDDISTKATEDMYKKAGIFFLNKDNLGKKIYLMKDIFKFAQCSNNEFTNVMRYIATLYLEIKDDVEELSDEVKYYLQWYKKSKEWNSKSLFLSNVIKSLLSSSNIESTVDKIARSKLIDFQKEQIKLLGVKFGNEHINDILDPCKKLLSRSKIPIKEISHKDRIFKDSDEDIF